MAKDQDDTLDENLDELNENQDDDTDNQDGEEDKDNESGEDGADDKDGDDDEGNKPITVTKNQLNKLVSDGINRHFQQRRTNKDQNRSRPYKPNPSKDGKGDNDQTNARIDAIELSNKKRDFGFAHNLSPKAVDLVFKFTGNKPDAKALKDPFIQGGLEKLKSSENLRNNTPHNHGSSNFEVKGKKFEELDGKDKQTNFQAKREAILASKKR